MTTDVESIRQFLLANRETILTWLIAGLVMMLLASFELRRAVRKSARAMSESVATTVAACVPDIAHAARAGMPHPDAHNAPHSPMEQQRADAFRRIALDTVGTIMARSRWLDEMGNLRLGEEALLAGRRAGGADPLLVVAPQPVVQAYLVAQGMFDDATASLQHLRRHALTLRDAALALDAEAAQIEQETASIVLRFEQVNAQGAVSPATGFEGGDYQRLLIQKYHALGNREKEVARLRAERRGEALEAADALAEQARDASLRYREALTPLMHQLRAAWGHGDSPAIFEPWLRRGAPAEAPARV